MKLANIARIGICNSELKKLATMVIFVFICQQISNTNKQSMNKKKTNIHTQIGLRKTSIDDRMLWKEICLLYLEEDQFSTSDD